MPSLKHSIDGHANRGPVTAGGDPMATTWRNDRPGEESWRPSADLTQGQRSHEQDAAAGGHDRRVISLPDGQTAVGSVCLRLPPKARRVYAYLRWSKNGTTSERY